MKTAAFSNMIESTADDWKIIVAHAMHDHQHFADAVLAHLAALDTLGRGGFQVSRLEHCLQTATRAHREGASKEMVVAALLHDLGDILSPRNHAELAATILRPCVSEECWWVVRYHTLFQGYHYFHHLALDRNVRERLRGHAYFESAVRFADVWDAPSFDPAYSSLPLEFFEPMVREIFAQRGRTPPFDLDAEVQRALENK